MSRARRRRMRLIRNLCFMIFIISLIVCGIVAGRYYKRLSYFKGDYTRQVDITGRAVSNIVMWLSDVEGADIDEDWIHHKIEPLKVSVNVSFNKENMKKGTITEAIDEQSYNECMERSCLVAAECLRELIIKRLTMVGYAESMNDEEADELIREVLGMTLDNYIKNSQVDILPSIEELNKDLCNNGSYEIKGKTIKLNFDGTELSTAYALHKDTIIFVDKGYVYGRKN